MSRFLALICYSYTQYFCITFSCAVVTRLQESWMNLDYWVLSHFSAAALATASVFSYPDTMSRIAVSILVKYTLSDKLCHFCHHRILSQFYFISIGLLSCHVLSFSEFSLCFIPSVCTSTCHSLFPETSLQSQL